MQPNIIHFENLWESCEKMAGPENAEEILGKISGGIDELRDIYKVSINSNDKKLVQGIKSKAVGRMLLALTALSAKENVDVYAALKEQLDVIKIKQPGALSI